LTKTWELLGDARQLEKETTVEMSFI